MAEKEKEIAQLQTLLKRYPNDDVDICGVILDYLGRTGESLYDVFELNKQIYHDLFDGDGIPGKELLECLIESERDVDELSNRCHDMYTKVQNVLTHFAPTARRGPEAQTEIHDLLSDPSKHLGYHVGAVIWQLSDIHFGKLNKQEGNPKELACMVARISADYPKLKPDFVVISGDVTSVALPEEFDTFRLFCKTLGESVWGAEHPHRILVVPGNHDITWGLDGTADQMHGFIHNLADHNVCTTPFGPDEETFPEDSIVIRRFNPNPATVPPFASVTCKEHDIELILLVSGYFSGQVPDEVQRLLKEANETQVELTNLLRVDEGAVNQEYLLSIAKSLSVPNASTRIGVIHHNPIQYGTERCANRLAPELLKTLRKNKVSLILHGHTHFVEDPSFRPMGDRQAYPIPCPTLCSICTAGGRGMNVHMIGDAGSTRKVSTVVWQISESSGFHANLASLRYRIALHEGDVTVQHF
ncbi:metallophosphoesterase [Patescibacteria group bacterium]|nr:metallophosphoesterase [Patescibacteria group bacterium]